MRIFFCKAIKQTTLIPVGLMILACGPGCKKMVTDDQPSAVKKWMVSTVAGTGEASFADGALLSAKFHFPDDVTVAADGTIYVTDGDNQSIRKIFGGQVTTYAGGSFGIVNGPGLSAQFKFPTNIASDASGNVYTTDARDPRIRKISPGAEVSTFAGSAAAGFADGNADTARFRGENSIVADAQGNVYVADAQNNRIRKISVSGKVSTIAGSDSAGFRDGQGEQALFNFPKGIAIDMQGNLFIADGANFRIRKITPSGQVSTIAGGDKQGSTDGDAGIARFEFPNDIVTDREGDLFVLDLSRIRKISPEGMVSTIAGSTDGYVDGDGASAKFYTPYGIGIDSQGNIWVADTNNNRIRKISFE
jgi:sugar lactone lactonase YvrE